MALQQLTFEGQTSGVTGTTGNIAAFGDAAATVTRGAGSVFQYDSAHPISGSTMGLLVSAVSTEQSMARFPAFTGTDKCPMLVRGFYLTAYPTISTAIASFRHAAGNEVTLNLDTTGRLYITDFSNTSVSALTTTALSLNTQYQIDWRTVIGATGTADGSAYLAYKTSGAGSYIQSLSSTTLNLGNNPLVSAQIGKTTTGGAIAGMYLDDISIDSGSNAFIPVTSTPLVISSVDVVPASGTAPLDVTATITASGGTGTTKNYIFDWGDSAVTGPQSSNVATHTYAAGQFSGTATVVNT